MRISDWSSDVCSSDLTSRSSEGSTAEVLAVVRVPLSQQGAASSRVREAKQVASQRRLQVREAIRMAREDAISAWDSLLTARAQIAPLEPSVRANDTARASVRPARTRVGLGESGAVRVHTGRGRI